MVGNHLHAISDVLGLQSALDRNANKYANVIVVAKSGGDFSNFPAALASITDASEQNPYLVKIMPGTYVVSNDDIAIGLPAYVDLEGSGRNVTKITSDTSLIMGYETLHNIGNGPNEVRDLTIEQTGSEARTVRLSSGNPGMTFRGVNVVASGSSSSIGIWFYGAGVLNLVNSSVVATGGGTATGIEAEGYDSLTMQDSSVQAIGSGATGINMNWNCTVSIANSDISGTYGIYSGGGQNMIRVKGSHIIGSSYSVLLAQYSGNTFLGSTVQLDGPMQPISAYKCVGCYNGNFDPLP